MCAHTSTYVSSGGGREGGSSRECVQGDCVCSKLDTNLVVNYD
jgi:hypothetical protein